ncbi:TetR/AcrR family transcriptional regulator [Fictibacillus phosphorivorans]|uniref:TetR/AcrR family transcriptional regulator n=1 Tax=Fictibacillus phosphorivorans TaxID=1221500 RepID=UPI002040FA39|nr:TetR/AcrR family transcriptional regulator [Fictibacillus phosphorivorans]MCM3718168.1 TetR/AcrR family transcriptional regulator [Fictibacillus phosphorivorans]MCM3775795.1 TetR/AcrR family transcriptional regulator [Fictibacillus phosphorivorans]
MNNKKRKVADIALTLFIEKGIQQTSIQEIIEKANISKGTFYNYFSSKSDCIADILEFLRYDASQQRIALQIGKDPSDRQVFIEQITTIMRLNHERNVTPLFEAILSSNEADLKKLVMQHRVYEMEWLSNRFIDIMGEDIREHAFEATVLFFGMVQHMLFTLRVTNSTFSLDEVVGTLLSYIELIAPKMIMNEKVMLNHSAIDLLRSNMSKNVVTKEDVIKLAEVLQDHHTFTEEQQDLFEVIMSELERERMRKVVLQPLLNPFQKLFDDTPVQSHVQKFTNMLWYLLKTELKR